jgi:hypothetical protein
MATAISPAIKPYSIAVAPSSQSVNDRTTLIKDEFHERLGVTVHHPLKRAYKSDFWKIVTSLSKHKLDFTGLTPVRRARLTISSLQEVCHILLFVAQEGAILLYASNVTSLTRLF